MGRTVLLSLVIVFSLVVPVGGQQPQSQSSAPKQQNPARDDDQDVVRITTNLVQVDAVVTKDGKAVTDLKANDFEIFEDGRPQTITNFSYVSNVPSISPPPAAARATEKILSPVPPAVIKSHDVRRTVAFVVDDLGMSFESMVRLRSQIRKSLDELSSNDLVAIIRTGGDIGALQQFTNDKRVLQSAVDHLRWNQCSRSGLYVFQPAGSIGDNRSLCAHMSVTLKSLKSILKGMSYLPGRKSMVLFSDFLPIENQEPYSLEQLNNVSLGQNSPGARSDSDKEGGIPDSGTSYAAQLQRIAELAIRASVVIYAVDTRGLPVTGLTAADQISYPPGGPRRPDQDPVLSLIRSRSALLLSGREGSDLIARQTGGFLIRNSNDFGLQQVMDDQQGYYLIGFRPNEETFNGSFHHLKAKLKRKGLTIRTRAGFYGYTDEQTRPPDLSVTDLMNKALISPFGENELTVHLTTFFVDEASQGPLLRSFLYLNPNDLTFTEQADGWRVASLDLRGALFGDNGTVIGEQDQTGTLRLRGASYERAVRDGIVYGFDIPVKQHGVFQFRVAVRDLSSAHIGSAGQFVELPDLRDGRLALSGIVAREAADLTQASGEAAARRLSSNTEQETITGGPAVRRFHQGTNLIFAYAIYNARLDGGTHLPQLSTQTRVFRDGRPIFTGDATPLDHAGQSDLQRIASASRLQLGGSMLPGEYVLQIIVTDSQGKEKPRVATQSIDFAVIE